MTLPELIDSLIELSTEEMPDEARKSLDDAIDHIVSSMTDGDLEGLLVKSVDKISDDEYMMSCSLFDNGKNSYNAYIIKIGDSGDIIWDKIFGGEENDRARSIVQTFDGGYVIAGSTCN